MNSAIHLPDGPGARSGAAPYTMPKPLHAGTAHCTLRMTGLADRVREAAGT